MKYWAVVYGRIEPYPIRHLCTVEDLPKTKEAFWNWYYSLFVKFDDDEVKLCDTFGEAEVFADMLKLKDLFNQREEMER